ncbi:hypothetical protein [Natribacillus halophilus]|nr:hypothetical protein [Natribacillus halophilus]
MNIIGKLLEDPTDTNFDIEPLIHGSMDHKIPELKLAIFSFITPEQSGKLAVIKKHYENLNARKSDLEELVRSLAKPYTEEINLILTVLSFKNIFLAIAVVSEIGIDMDVFPTAKHLCSWSGLTRQITKVPARKSQSECREQGAISSPF